MSDDAHVRRLSADLAEAEARLKLAIASSDWRAAAKFAGRAADLQDQLEVAKAPPGAPTNVVGRPKVRG